MENTEITEKTENSENRDVLSLRHLVKVYPNGEKAVYDFNLEIDKNEFIVIVGPSGCGKSTTLRMVAGLEDVTEGDIYLNDELLNYKPCKDRHMAIVFQSYALYPQMTVYQNIAFPLTINKYPAPVVNETLLSCARVRELLESIGVERFAKAIYSQHSSKLRRGKLAEDLAVLLDIEPCSAKLIVDLFRSLDKEKRDALADKKDEVLSEWLKKLDEKEAHEKAKLAQNGVKLNEKFHELNADGTEKTVTRKPTSFEIRTRVYETADKLDLTPYLDKLPKELSGGQMQRVALGRAIIKNVPIFLMDEPLSNLDAKLRLTMRSEIVKLHSRINATTIYVTHDQIEAMTMASRIVVMSRGFVQQIDTPEEIYNNPANVFVARFIGSPSMNIFEMEYDKDKNAYTYGGFDIPAFKGFKAKYEAFYAQKCDEFEQINANFDLAAREKVLKVQSVLGENKVKTQTAKKVGFIARTVNFFKNIAKKKDKEKEKEDAWAKEKTIAKEKLDDLRLRLDKGSKVLVGIRPEQLTIEKVTAGKKYDGYYVTEPTLTELLGGEYSVHFEFCGRNTIGKLNAKSKLGAGDKIAVKFSTEDLYIFDPVTGDVIK